MLGVERVKHISLVGTVPLLGRQEGECETKEYNIAL